MVYFPATILYDNRQNISQKYISHGMLTDIHLDVWQNVKIAVSKTMSVWCRECLIIHTTSLL